MTPMLLGSRVRVSPRFQVFCDSPEPLARAQMLVQYAQDRYLFSYSLWTEVIMRTDQALHMYALA